MTKIAVLYGSVRTGRQGIKAARFLVNELKKRGHTINFIDPKEFDLPMIDKMYKELDTAPDDMERLHKILAAADGYLIVSGEYNHSIPPALKNLLDHFQTEYYFKPAGIVTYSAGPFGGVRCAVHLRAILGELGMVTPSIMFPISKVGPSFHDDGTPTDTAYERRVQRFLDEFDWYVAALQEARKKGIPF